MSVQRKLCICEADVAEVSISVMVVSSTYLCEAPWSQVINLNQKGQWSQQTALGHGTIEVLPV